jgi:basic membrane protein A
MNQERMTMSSKRVRFVASLFVTAMVAAACSPAPAATPPTAVPTAVPATVSVATPLARKLCQVTDLAGVNDHAFNALAWTAAQAAAKDQGWEAAVLESRLSTDYDSNLNADLNSGACGLILTVGEYIGPVAQAAGAAHVDQKFLVVNFANKPDLPNVWDQVYATEQGAFLAGYLAAAMSKTGKIGTFGGDLVPDDANLEIGFQEGMQYYNTKHNAKVVLLGWDTARLDGSITSSYTDQSQGTLLAKFQLADGADVIMPVAGQASLGAFAAVKAAGHGLVIGVGQDQFTTAPEYQDILLTSVMQRVDLSVQTAAKALADGRFQGGRHVGNLTTGEIGLAPYHNLDGQVPQSVKDELKQIAADIASGAIKVDNWSSRETAKFEQALAALPKTGDASRGQALTLENKCVVCHIDAPIDISTIAPGWLASADNATPKGEGIGTRAQHRFKDPDYTGAATSADGYLLESIIEPDAYVVHGFAIPSAMPTNFFKHLKPQDLADIIAYLDTLK